MNKKILFFDIDGTLVDCTHGKFEVSPRLVDAIKQLQNNGHLCMIASGRPYSYLNKEILDIGFDGYILCNGAIVNLHNEFLIKHCFPKAQVKALVELFEKHHMEYSLCDYDVSYIKKEFTYLRNTLKAFQVHGATLVDTFDLDDINVLKIEVRCDDKDYDIITNLKSDYELICYDDIKQFEINTKGVSKGKTITEVLAHLNYNTEDAIAFGDGDNDIEMLSVVGHGCAMGNATKSAKQHASKVIDSCINDGIYKELRDLGLID